MKINFFKMHGAGNDYIFVDERTFGSVTHPSKVVEIASKRRFSVGSDGLVLISEENGRSCRMRIFNADGSEGMTCGNALRCVGWYLHENGEGERFTVATCSGDRVVTVSGDTVTVDMGRAVFRSPDLPPCGIFVMQSESEEFAFTTVSVGNPHAVAFVSHLDFNVGAVANELASSGIFPFGVNVEFALPRKLGAEVRVVERGSGETLSCGSGACAVAAAMKLHGLIDGRAELHFRGGVLAVDVADDYGLKLSGSVEKSFEGVVEIDGI